MRATSFAEPPVRGTSTTVQRFDGIDRLYAVLLLLLTAVTAVLYLAVAAIST